MKNDSLMEVKSIVECSPWSILQYFEPALRDNWYWKPIFVFLLSAHLRQVLLYYVLLLISVFLFNQYKFSFLFVDQSQTVQTQIRHRSSKRNRMIQKSHC